MSNDFPAENGTQHNSEPLLCPNCQHPYRIGELACPNCHFVLSSTGKTTKFDDEVEGPGAKHWPTGEVIINDRKPIRFEISGKEVAFNIDEMLTVGRASDNILPRPDIDLTDFEAEKHGVSRIHIRLRRKGNLIYVSDLMSTNGTQLNGRKLISEGERVLRDGDELFLGRLRVRIRF